ncbi:hypothetical protein BX666DRAFT_1899736 [Dichotomocladium elegans]|nr:hypothetical protein BX666DRAFT_1899736 [Dichotomocladium elegans]
MHTHTLSLFLSFLLFYLDHVFSCQSERSDFTMEWEMGGQIRNVSLIWNEACITTTNPIFYSPTRTPTRCTYTNTDSGEYWSNRPMLSFSISSRPFFRSTSVTF